MKRYLIGCAWMAACHCALSEQVQKVEQVLVVAPYTATEEVPITYSDLSEEDIKRHSPLSEPSFLLAQTPSVTAYSDAGSMQGYSYFRLRGMDQTRVNMTLDGVPLNEPEDQGVYFSNYPGIFGALESVQVQRGVGISQNGTASYAGSVQLISVNVDQPKQGRLYVGAGSYDTLAGAAELFTGRSDVGSGYLRVSSVRSNGYKYHSGNRSHSLFASGMTEAGPGTWKLTAFSGEQHNELAWLGVSEQQISQDRRFNANANEHDEFRQSLVFLNNSLELSNSLHVKATVYYNELAGHYDFDLNNFLGVSEAGPLLNFAFESELVGAFSTLDVYVGSLHITSGLHLNQYARDHIGTEQDAGLLYINTGYKDSYSGFVKTLYTANSATVFADLQYRKTTFDYKGSVEMERRNWSFLNPKVGVSYALNERLTTYVSVGKVGREPTRTDMFGGNEDLGLSEQGEPALYVVDSERVTDYQAGLRYRGSRAQLSANLFHLDFDNEITLSGQFGPNGLPLHQDVDSSIRQGLELEAAVGLSHNWNFKSSASFMRAKIEHGQEEFEPILTPETVVDVGLNYEGATVSFGVDARFVDESFLNFANDARLDSHVVVDLYGRYRFSGAELELKVNNVFDKKYVGSGAMDINGHPSYFVAAPINLFLAVKVNL